MHLAAAHHNNGCSWASDHRPTVTHTQTRQLGWSVSLKDATTDSPSKTALTSSQEDYNSGITAWPLIPLLSCALKNWGLYKYRSAENGICCKPVDTAHADKKKNPAQLFRTFKQPWGTGNKVWTLSTVQTHSSVFRQRKKNVTLHRVCKAKIGRCWKNKFKKWNTVLAWI